MLFDMGFVVIGRSMVVIVARIMTAVGIRGMAVRIMVVGMRIVAVMRVMDNGRTFLPATKTSDREAFGDVAGPSPRSGMGQSIPNDVRIRDRYKDGHFYI